MTLPTKTVSFRIDHRLLLRLDAIAAAEKRDRTFILNQAIEQYIAKQAKQKKAELI